MCTEDLCRKSQNPEVLRWLLAIVLRLLLSASIVSAADLCFTQTGHSAFALYNSTAQPFTLGIVGRPRHSKVRVDGRRTEIARISIAPYQTALVERTSGCPHLTTPPEVHAVAYPNMGS